MQNKEKILAPAHGSRNTIHGPKRQFMGQDKGFRLENIDMDYFN